MSWDLQLERASFGGVEFDCQSIDDEISRRMAEHAYPYRDGAELEDIGRKARPTHVRAVFMGDDYEGRLGELLAIIDTGRPREFVHPILGSWTARVVSSRVHHEHGTRDLATVDLDLVEDGVNTALPDLFSIQGEQASVELACVEVEAEASLALPELPAALTDAIDDVRAFAADVEDMAGEIAAAVDKVRKRIDAAIKAVRALTDVSNWGVVRALKRTAHACQKLAKRVVALHPPVVLKRTAAAMPLRMLAHALYGDASREADIRKLNRIRNTFNVPAGTEIKVYSR